jgi:cyclopropane-fatty-acyl-phospholipid synthase
MGPQRDVGSRTDGSLTLEPDIPRRVRTISRHLRARRHLLYQWLDAALARAGARLDGQEPWDPQIRHPRALRRIWLQGSRGAGEAYVDGDWDVDALDELYCRILVAHADAGVSTARLHFAPPFALSIGNRQSRRRARAAVVSHYDIGEDLYRAMLGSTMAYSCGYWAGATTLDGAQHAKFDVICRKLGIRPGHRLLDIGCGWGGLAAYAAERFGAAVTGITLSPGQAAVARQRARGLNVRILEQDYRDVDGTFDRVVSVGMLEHVGPANYHGYFDAVRRHLAGDGLALVHTIGALTPGHASDAWIERYIFPDSVLPSAAQLTRAFEGLFVLEDWENIGAHYDRTLMAWHRNVEAAWPDLSTRYSERFRRMWRYYLLTCAAGFRARRNQVWQLVLSPAGVPAGYRVRADERKAAAACL